MKIELYNKDCFDKLKELRDNSVDAIVTDPPYFISFMNKGWDKEDSIASKKEFWAECLRVTKPGGYLLAFGHSRTHHRLFTAVEDAGWEIRDTIMWLYGSGFPKSLNIGKAIDKVGPSINTDIKDIKDKMIGYFKQSRLTKTILNNKCGFTAANYFRIVSKRPDPWVNTLPTEEKWKKMVEVMGYGEELTETLSSYEREIVGQKLSGCFSAEERHTIGSSTASSVNITKGNSDWEGWGTALKPAHEPICMARKPIDGNVVNNIKKWGVGGINIDACRVGTEIISTHNAPKGTFAGGEPERGSDTSSYTEHEGRFPANIILDEEAGTILDEQTGITSITGKRSQKSIDNCIEARKIKKGNSQCDVGGNINKITEYANDSGGASRFFHCVGGKRVINKVRTIPVHSTDKKEDKTMFGLHPTIQHERVETTLGRFPANIILDEEAGVILDKQAPQVGSMFKATRKKGTSGGSGNSWTNSEKKVGEDNGIYDGLGGASRFYYCAKVSSKERNRGCDDLEKKDKAGKDFRPNHKVKAELGEDGNPFGRWGKIANNHPTVKPIALMEYLIKLISKEGHTILDPFMGSGSTGIAAKKMNRSFIGIEMDEGYHTIASKRIGEDKKE